MTSPIPPDILPVSILGTGGIIVKGTIRCAYFKCGKRRHEQVCPHCGRAPCCIVLYWKGRTYTYRRDPQGLQFSYPSAALFLNRIISDINDEKKGLKTFNPEEYSTGRMKARKLEFKAEEWLAIKEGQAEAGELSHETLKNYRGYVKNYWIPLLGHYDVRDIRFPELEKFKDDLPFRLKKKTKRNVLNGLRTFYTWLKRRMVLSETPVFPTVEGDDADVRRAVEVEDQWGALARIPEEHRGVIEFGMETGLRPGETCALKIRDLDMDSGMALIQRTWSGAHLRETTKGKNKRWIPLSNRALEILAVNIEKRFPEEFVFLNPGTGRCYRQKTLNQVWRQYSEIDCTYYEASRHSFCTQIVEMGVSSIEAKELMRHENIKSTMHYYHGSARRQRELVNRRGKIVQLKAEKE